jgi:hypothetical protein
VGAACPNVTVNRAFEPSLTVFVDSIRNVFDDATTETDTDPTLTPL